MYNRKYDEILFDDDDKRNFIPSLLTNKMNKIIIMCFVQ